MLRLRVFSSQARLVLGRPHEGCKLTLLGFRLFDRCACRVSLGLQQGAENLIRLVLVREESIRSPHDDLGLVDGLGEDFGDLNRVRNDRNGLLRHSDPGSEKQVFGEVFILLDLQWLAVRVTRDCLAGKRVLLFNFVTSPTCRFVTSCRIDCLEDRSVNDFLP